MKQLPPAVVNVTLRVHVFSQKVTGGGCKQSPNSQPALSDHMYCHGLMAVGMPVETGENARTHCICIDHAGFILLWESLPNRTAAERSGATAGRCAVPDRVWAGAKRAAGWPWPGLQPPLLRRRASGRPLVMHAGFQSGHRALLIFPTIDPTAAATPQPRAGIRRGSALLPFPLFRFCLAQFALRFIYFLAQFVAAGVARYACHQFIFFQPSLH